MKVSARESDMMKLAIMVQSLLSTASESCTKEPTTSVDNFVQNGLSNVRQAAPVLPDDGLMTI